MPVGLFTHPGMLDHRPGIGHPERPERLTAVLDALAEAPDLDLDDRDAPLAELADLAAVHPQAHAAERSHDRGRDEPLVPMAAADKSPDLSTPEQQVPRRGAEAYPSQPARRPR